MFDIVLEVLKAFILIVILVFLVRANKSVVYGRRGWLFIQIGFLFLVFGSFMDIADNFESLRWSMITGHTSLQSFLEKFVGYLGGFVLIGIGLWLWLPSIKRMDVLEKEARETRRHLEFKVMERTRTLDKEFDSYKKVETALRQTEEYRQILYEKAPIGISHGLIGGSLVARNAAFARMLGYASPEELEEIAKQKEHFGFFWHDENDFKILVNRLRTEKHISDFETRFNCKDGSVVWVRMTFTTLADRNGKNYYFFSFANDITEQKKAVDALGESEQRLERIIDSLPAGVYLVDMKTRNIASVNTTALHLLGYSQAELVGSPCNSSLCPMGIDSCPVLDREKSISNQKVELLRKDGTALSVIKTVARVVLDGREYLLEVFVDISEQVRLEQLKKDVDRIVSHDLKSPIIGMINSCTVLLMENDIQGENREILELIQQQGNKVLRMISMSLSVYKMEAGTYEYVPESVDFVGVINRVIKEQAEVARNKSVTVVVTLETGVPTFPVMGEEILYDSMFANLLSNAIEASPEGQTVNVSLVGGHQPRLVITNSGAVPASVRQTFFDKYVTADKKGGTGLGTYSANLVARTMGGSIVMNTSDEDEVTTITVFLPVFIG